MKLEFVKIHNFRSIKDVEFFLNNYSLIVGENNSGKTNILNAIRMVYENSGLKWSKEIDFPKFATDDNESWIELTYLTTSEEQQELKEEYKSNDKLLKIRKYFCSNALSIQKDQSNIFGYENGILSNNLFYGAKNISQAKLGELIYIPAISKIDDTLKLSGPSPLRDMLNFVMKKAVFDSPSYLKLAETFEKFNDEFRDEASKDGFSINELVSDINNEIKFGIKINPVKPEDITKGMLSHWLEDKRLDNEKIDISSFGQGLQRHLIFSLIKLANKYQIKATKKKKEFKPEFLLVLFEEPEAFLHPSQQEILRLNLQKLASNDDQQIICTTHSPHFVSKQIYDLHSIIKLSRNEKDTKAYHISKNKLNNIIHKNSELYELFSQKLSDTSIPANVKETIRSRHLGEDIPNLTKKYQEESFKYFLHLDSERSALFFAKHVIICEGASEKIFFDTIIDDLKPELRENQIYILDSLGKFNIHRFMQLFEDYGINHSVIYDGDENRNYHDIVNNFLEQKKNLFTKIIFTFPNDLEDFLAIGKPARNDLKPLNLMIKYHDKQIDIKKINDLIEVLEKCLI